MLWSGRGIRNEDKKCQHIAVCWQREKSPDVNVQYHHSIWVDNSQAARANGIPEDYVEMYQSGDIPYLCDAVTAAMGKLDVECGSLKLAGLMNDWVEYIRGLCMEDEMVAHQVRKKGKSLKQCIAEILKYAFKNQVPVDKEIIKAAGVNAGKVTFGDPDMGTAKKLIRDYYLGGSRK